ncbi:uncharacterized protein TM35_000083280 [Trypanosoma theileri]|uniref:Uncharacterized protein n=1 Tax=Trypanosoma theileri TaxID=67003 RepID=A0A1X0P2A7_9TRYP|nr:uncharacterized protein TM35_000083280 [Trypanosoma theileri]ORC90530.1 hypothetical protein TM35_000083280 [Trypanosoma theileri]
MTTVCNGAPISTTCSSQKNDDDETNKKNGNSGSIIPSRTSETVFDPPPVYDDICRFIAEYAGRLPRDVFTGTAPYEYTGCDYALILYAILPSRCIDLSRLCWSTTPLPSQLEANLVVFCEGARRLELCDAPSSSLHPQHLRSTPACIVHHIKVQHWLYVLSQRFRPEGSFDPVTLRMELRHIQLGEPRLTGTTIIPTSTSTTSSLSSLTMAGRVVGATGSSLSLEGVKMNEMDREEAFCFPSLHCNALWKVAAVNCKRTSTESTQTTRKRAAGEAEVQQNSTKSYSRPWRSAPSGTTTAGAVVNSNTTTTNKISSRQPLQKQQTAVQTSSTTGEVSSNATKSISQLPLKSIAEQWSEYEERRLHLKETLELARNTTQSMLFTNGAIDFDNILSILHQKQL